VVDEAASETTNMRAPEVRARPEWIPLEPLRLEGGRGSFVSGDPEGDRVRVAYFRRPQDAVLVGRAWFGPGAVGPPQHVHGGAITAVLDEAMGAAAWLAGHVVVAARLSTDFRRLLPIGTDALFEAWIEGVEGRKVRARGRLLAEDGAPYAEAEALFVVLDPERFGEMLRRAALALGRDPEELLRQARRSGA
jgi:acyl-coenzyme A thioesterase PaaI-like protein